MKPVLLVPIVFFLVAVGSVSWGIKNEIKIRQLQSLGSTPTSTLTATDEKAVSDNRDSEWQSSISTAYDRDGYFSIMKDGKELKFISEPLCK